MMVLNLLAGFSRATALDIAKIWPTPGPVFSHSVMASWPQTGLIRSWSIANEFIWIRSAVNEMASAFSSLSSSTALRCHWSVNARYRSRRFCRSILSGWDRSMNVAEIVNMAYNRLSFSKAILGTSYCQVSSTMGLCGTLNGVAM